jgi:hypothetical protein
LLHSEKKFRTTRELEFFLSREIIFQSLTLDYITKPLNHIINDVDGNEPLAPIAWYCKLILQGSINMFYYLCKFSNYEKKFRTTRELEFFLSREIIFQSLTLDYITKTLNHIICFPPPKSEYFFQQHWESEYLF